MKLEPYITPRTRISSKGIKNLNIRPETIKLLEENTGKSSLTFWSWQQFFAMTQKVQATKAKRNKWDYIKPKSLCTAEETTDK